MITNTTSEIDQICRRMNLLTLERGTTLSSFEVLPQENMVPITAVSELSSLGRLVCTSKTMYEKVFTEIARSSGLVGDICSVILRLNDMDGFVSFFSTLKKQKSGVPEQISLELSPSSLNYGFFLTTFLTH
jgi:hypothetical protein